VISMTFSSSKSANTSYSIKDSSGNTIIEYTPTKLYSNVVVYCAAIKSGSAYTIVSAGKDVVTATPTTLITNMSVSGITTGKTNGGMGGGGMGGGGKAPNVR